MKTPVFRILTFRRSRPRDLTLALPLPALDLIPMFARIIAVLCVLVLLSGAEAASIDRRLRFKRVRRLSSCSPQKKLPTPHHMPSCRLK